jgi:hypothetical protein
MTIPVCTWVAQRGACSSMSVHLEDYLVCTGWLCAHVLAPRAARATVDRFLRPFV